MSKRPRHEHEQKATTPIGTPRHTPLHMLAHAHHICSKFWVYTFKSPDDYQELLLQHKAKLDAAAAAAAAAQRTAAQQGGTQSGGPYLFVLLLYLLLQLCAVTLFAASAAA